MVDNNRQLREYAQNLLRHCEALGIGKGPQIYPVQAAMVEEQIAYENLSHQIQCRFRAISNIGHGLEPEWALQRYLHDEKSKQQLLDEFTIYQVWQDAMANLRQACRATEERIRKVQPGWRG